MTDSHGGVLSDFAGLTGLIAGLAQGTVRSFTPPSSDQISSFEEGFGLQLPESYTQLVLAWGALSCGPCHILGIGQDVPYELQVAGALLGLRIECPGIDPCLVPIEDLGDGALACLDCNTGAVQRVQCDEDGQVILQQLARDLVAYLQTRFPPEPGAEPDLQRKRLAKHVSDFNDRTKLSHTEGGKLPKAYDWRPWRYCVQDVMLGAIVLRHSRTRNLLEIDVWLTADPHEDFPDFHGGRGLLNFALTEAFHCGGSMAMDFLSGRPKSFDDLASAMGVSLNDPRMVLPGEAQDLYLKLLGFSPEFAQCLQQLAKANYLQIERACYLVSHGVWSKAELEALVRASPDPSRVLAGGAPVLCRHLFLEDLYQGRGVALGGWCDQALAYRQTDGEELEDNVRPLTIGFDSARYSKKYCCDTEAVPLPWPSLCPDMVAGSIPAGTPFEVVIRAREVADIVTRWPEDVAMAAQTQPPAFLLYSHDVLDVAQGVRNAMCLAAKDSGVTILIGPEPVTALDDDVLQRFEDSRLVRQ